MTLISGEGRVSGEGRGEKGTSPPAPSSTFLVTWRRTIEVWRQKTKKGGGMGEVPLPRRVKAAAGTWA